MKIFKDYNQTFTFKIDKSKDEVIAKIIKQTRKPLIEDDVIEVNYRPSFFNAFEAKGSLRFSFNSTNNNKTEIVCKICPKKEEPYRFYLLITLLLLWTFAAFFISFSLNSLLIVIIGWTTMLVILWISKILNQGKLENHATYIVDQIK